MTEQFIPVIKHAPKPSVPSVPPKGPRLFSWRFTAATIFAAWFTVNAVNAHHRNSAKRTPEQPSTVATHDAQAIANRQAYLAAASERDARAAKEARQRLAGNDASAAAFEYDAALDASTAPSKGTTKKPRMVFGRPIRTNAN